MIERGTPGRFDEREYELLAPAIAAITQSPEADQLCTALALVDGFQFDLAVCPTPRTADALLMWLAVELPKRRGREVRFERLRAVRAAGAKLTPITLTESVLSQLETVRSDPSADTVVVIDSTGYRSDEHDAWRWLFQRCNERRNHIAAVVGAPLLWLLSPDLEAAFPADAPDLWSIRSVSVHLPDQDVFVPRDAAYHSTRFEPGALERARATVAALRTTADPDVFELARALRRLAEQELAHGHVTDTADVLTQLVPLRAKIDDPLELAKIDRLEAEHLQILGDGARALSILRERVVPTMERQGTAYQRAMTYRVLASALVDIGDLDGALAQLRKHALPLDEQLQDDHGRAETLGQIADVLEIRGNLDESLLIRREDVLPAFDRLGDVRSRAVTLGKIANVLFARGELDEALRIRREEALPIFDQLGDTRSRAVSLDKIADILHRRGDLDEALRIRKEEALPAFEQLGDLRSRAIVLDKIADILSARGSLDEALRIRMEDVLPELERVGDTRSRTATLGKLAILLFARGQHREALRICKEQVLPVLEQMGDAQNLYGALMSYARMLFASAAHPKALEEARDCLRRAAQIADQCGFPFQQQLRDELATLERAIDSLSIS